MSLYPAPPTGYYDRIYSRYTGDIYGSTLLGGNGDEKTIGDWSMGMPGTGLGFSTSGPYGMMMTSSYEQFARNVFPPEIEMVNTHTVDFMSSGDRLPASNSARLKPEPEIAGDTDQLQRDSSDNSTGSDLATITAAAADTSVRSDDVIKKNLNDRNGNDVETAGHVFAPDSEHHGHERHCLLWACKTCKKRSAAAVDRRKVGYVVQVHAGVVLGTCIVSVAVLVCNYVCFLVISSHTKNVTAVAVKVLEERGTTASDHAIKLTRWQHPTMWHDSRQHLLTNERTDRD